MIRCARHTFTGFAAALFAFVGAVALTLPASAEVKGRDIVADDPAAAEALSRLESREANASIEVLDTQRLVNPVTGNVYTLLKARVGVRDLTAALNETTGAFALDAALPDREAQEVLARLPKVYRKMSATIVDAVRRAQGERLGENVIQDEKITVTFHAMSSQALDAIERELHGTAIERFDADALWNQSPPLTYAREDTPAPAPAAPPRIFTISASVTMSELLRVGALEGVVWIDVRQVMTERLDASVPRIHGNTIQGYGLKGTSAKIGIVDSGIDKTHPALPFVVAEQDFTMAGMVCDGGPRRGACQSNCPGGACSTRTRVCVGGGAAGQTCCPGAVCELPTRDTGGHGTHVAGIAGSLDATYRGEAPLADLINAKAIPGTNAPGALAWSTAQGANVINGSYGTSGVGCLGRCTAPAGSVGMLCGANADCDSAPNVGDGVCAPLAGGPPLNTPCLTNAQCDPPAAPGTGRCSAPISDGQSGSTRAVDLEVFTNNVTVAIAGEERPYNGRCSNATGTACNGDNGCPAGGHCLAFPSTPNDTFNGITVGASNIVPGTSVVSSFSVRGPASGNRSKPDVLAPGEAPPAGVCVGGGANGNPCNDVLGDTDCPGGNCTSTRCIGRCTAPGFLVGAGCSANADCDSSTGTGDGACNLGASFGNACTDVNTSGECPGGYCSFVSDADGIDSCAMDWEGNYFGRCAAPAARLGVGCFVNADCDSPAGALNGVCAARPGGPAPNAAKPDFVDKEGTSMATPHVAGLAAQLWDFGKNQNIIKDTPYLKATILNTANRLAGWSRLSVSQPLDIAQGTGEVDALEAFHAYADDLRVWQQQVTGIAPKDSHWYWSDLPAGVKQAYTLVFERHETAPGGAFRGLNDVDLRLYSPGGVPVDSSISSVDSVEHIVYTPPSAGRYCLEVDPYNLTPAGPELYAVAGTLQRLNFLGTVNPCVPDFGDAPDPFTGPAHYPTKLASNGARHKDWTKEWLGNTRPEIDGDLVKKTLAVHSRVDPFPSVSGEVDATDPADQDGIVNLVDQDGWDDGVVIPGPFLPGVPKIIKVTVQCTVGDTGIGPTGRYDATVPTKRLYLNAWADWNGNGNWAEGGEKIIGIGSPTGQFPVDPQTFGINGRYTIGEAYTDSNGSGRWEPGESFTDTVGKSERTFSFVVTPPPVIAPDFYLRFRVDYGEDVSHVANVSGNLSEFLGEAQFGEVEDYENRYENDIFTLTTATVDLRYPADSTTPHLVTLTGPTAVKVDLGGIHDSDGNGREQVTTEMTMLTLSGTDPTFGPVTVSLRDPGVEPFHRSTGQIEETTNGNSGLLDMAPFVTTSPNLCSQSTFNVYFEVSLPSLGLTLHNHRPKFMTSTIYYKPPQDPYSSYDYVPLYDSVHNVVATLGPVIHEPSQPPRKREVDIFSNSRAQMDIRVPAGSAPNIITLEGPTTVAVDLGGLADTDNNNLEQVTTEMTNLDLHGTSGVFGPIIVHTRPSSRHPFMRTVGQIEENSNLNPGILDLPPFVTSPAGLSAASSFDVYLEIEVPNYGLRLHNHIPKHMTTTMTHKPPAPGEVYQSPQIIPLYDDNESAVGEIGPGYHIPNPANDTGGCCLNSTCFVGESAQCVALGGSYRGDGTGCSGACIGTSSPPGVPSTLHVQKLDPSGSSLAVTWSSSCSAPDYHLLYGRGGQLPTGYSGIYQLTGGVCSTGGASAMTWSAPAPSDPTRLVWFVVAANDGLTEGPWGRNSGGIDRMGPGPGGSSGVCYGGKSLSNTCGQSSCSSSGAVCSSNATCCSGTCTGGVCCGADGSACSSNAQCCGGTCAGGVCSSPCRPIGQTCTLSSQCCTGNCSGGTCQAACTPSGGACTSSGQCCGAMTCFDGVCRETCTSNGASCETPGQCCSGTCTGGQCCAAPGASCGTSSECCDGACVNGACQASCYPAGQPCATSTQCCSQNCQGGVCQSGCAADGTSCTFSGQCCSGSCLAGTCQAVCSDNGAACGANSECCGGQCRSGTCCASTGATCTSDGECCVGGCRNGRCTADTCMPVGEPCAQNGECCSGSCVGGLCSSCSANGQSCSNPSQCCSAVCQNNACCGPPGFTCSVGTECCSGNCQGGFCQSCSANGQSCSDPSQCCSGVCQGGACCAPPGLSCSSGSECCSGSCQGGFCQACGPVGTPCTTGSQCCTTLCFGGFCQSCLPNGGTGCTSSSQCCAGTCSSGRCCGAGGSPCGNGAQCCSNVCNAGICASSCSANGQPCGSPGQCCSGNCSGGVCQACFSGPQPCTTGSQCCSNVCSGGICQPCNPGGTPCTLPSQCCSNSCQGGFCTTCVPTGSSCVSNSQCCSHFCSGGICQLTLMSEE